MRAVAFRLLAGVLAIAFGWLLVAGDTSRMSRMMLAGLAVVGVAFGVFAVAGSGPAERVLAWWLGPMNNDPNR